MKQPDERGSGKNRNSTPCSDVDMAYQFLTHHLPTGEQPEESHPNISARLLHFKERWKRLLHKKSA